MNADITRFVRSLNHPHIMKMHEVYFEQAGPHHVLAENWTVLHGFGTASRQMGFEPIKL